MNTSLQNDAALDTCTISSDFIVAVDSPISRVYIAMAASLQTGKIFRHMGYRFYGTILHLMSPQFLRSMERGIPFNFYQSQVPIWLGVGVRVWVHLYVE